MKALLLLATIAVYVANGLAETPSFCLTATDEYGGDPTSTDAYSVPEGPGLTNYYIVHDTGTTTRARVQVFANGSPGPVWYTDCGCGTNVFEYPTGQNPVLHFEVECVSCPGTSITSGSVFVKIYTPVNNACKTACNEG